MKPLVYAIVFCCCMHSVYQQVTKTQKGYYICIKDGDILTVRANLLKDTDPVNQIRSVYLDGTDIDDTICPISGDGSATTPWRFESKIDCTHLPRLNDDMCGVRYETTATTTLYTWRHRTRQVWNLNCEYDAIFKFTCDCNNATDTEMKVITASVSTVPEQDAIMNICDMRLELWNEFGNAELATGGPNGYYLMRLGQRYTIRGEMRCNLDRENRVNPYGFFMKNVRISNNPRFEGSDVYTLVDENGCRVDYNGDPPQLSNDCFAGFPPAGNTALDWIYQCRTFEAISFRNAPQDLLYISAEFEFCYDFQDITCIRKCNTLGRKRRKRSTVEANGYDTNVTVRVVKAFITTENDPRNWETKTQSCEMDDTYITVFAVLGALLFFITIISTIMAICLVRMCRRRPVKIIESSAASNVSIVSSKAD